MSQHDHRDLVDHLRSSEPNDYEFPDVTMEIPAQSFAESLQVDE